MNSSSSRPGAYGTLSSDEEAVRHDLSESFDSTPNDALLQGRQHKVKNIRKFLWNSIFYIGGAAMVALFLVTFQSQESNVATTTNVYSDRAPTGYLPGGIYTRSTELGIVATNEYGQFTSKAMYPWMNEVPGTQLVEPYKETALTVVGSLVNGGRYTYTWTIDNYNEDGTSFIKSGKFQTTQKITFTRTGTYSITVEALDTQGSLVSTFSTSLICKYVKRELRTLTATDKEKFLKAAKTLWEVNSNKGVAMYGEKYTSIERLVDIHSLASNDIMCDGFHEGSGFLTHHLALTNTFEAALRSVDPSVTLPYWDFSIEGEAIVAKGEKPSYLLEISPFFSHDWFGAVDADNHISNSRWAHIQMPMQTQADGVRNSYGFIRSYWNNNNDTQVNRKLFKACGIEPLHKTVPSCKDHFALLNATTLGEFQLLSPADGHGPMHVQLGGVWGGCDDAVAAFYEKWKIQINENLSNDDIRDMGFKVWKWGNHAPRKIMLETAIVGEYFHIYRSFWRSHMCAVDGTPNLLVCPESCDASVPFEECSCQVDALVNGETTWQNLLPCVLNSEENLAYFKASFPDEMMEDMVYMLATSSVKEGEMIESASTADPMFWLIHPAIERLLAAKRLGAHVKMGSKEYHKWDDYTGASEEWLQYSYYTFEEGKNGYFADAFTCYGHGAEDKVLPDALKFTDAIMNVADSNGDKIISNWEFYLAIDPNNVDGNDYVFDHFEWDHCA